MDKKINSHHWLPFTNNCDFLDDPKLLKSASGMYYWDQYNNKVLDGGSGLFCSPAGHCVESISNAVYQQLKTLDYAPHFMRATEQSFQLSEMLSALLPDLINHIFYCGSGSEAVDTAMKIALAYHRSVGNGQKQRFVSRERSYHGVNFGGVALSGMLKNREAYGVGLPGVIHMRHTWLEGNSFTPGQPEDGAFLAEDLQRHVDLYGADTIAACFVEPIAGSTGILVPPKGYLERLRAICDQNNILLVFDEVITGFGRTGNPFASQTFNVTPDIITMAKAITNGAQPMGAVAVSSKIYDAFMDKSESGLPELFHGYTYSCHPAASAAALESLRIYQEEGLFERARSLTPLFQEAVHSLADLGIVKDIRSFGLLGGVDLKSQLKPGILGYQVQKKLFEEGLHLKTTGDCAILAPAFISEPIHIEKMINKLKQVLQVFDAS